ncbi:MAG: fibronectin type III domain-containing protein [Prevotella sp.]|nr:fibronectin type III domain-containing protein [Prevotella sp.]
MALMLVPWVTQAQTLTVADGTTTNEMFPVYGYSGDTPGTTSEFVIPSTTDGMSAMVGKTITSMTFYHSSSEVSIGATFQVYLTEISGTTLSGVLGPGACTVVYTGSLDQTGSTMTVTFDDGYVYQGGNLLVGTYITIAGGYPHIFFNGIEATGAAYLSGDWGGYSTGSYDFIPKTTFTYETPSACNKPGAIVLGAVNPTSAAITWTAGGSETSWKVYANDAYVTTVTSPSYTYTSLTPNTDYTLAVTAICGSDESNPRTVTIHTPCVAIDVTSAQSYTASFTTAVPDCWTYAGEGNNWNLQADLGVYAYSTTYGSTVTSQKLVSPLFNIASGTYWLNYSGQSGNVSYDASTTASLSVYYRTSVDGEWFLLSDATRTGASSGESLYAEAVILPAGTCQLAFEASVGYYAAAVLSSMTIMEQPSCLPVNNLVVSNITGTTADITWTAGGEETSWKVYLYDENSNLLTGYPVTVSSPSYTYQNLEGLTTYIMGVKAACTGSDSPLRYGSFTTAVACANGSCELTFQVTDAWGDGWNGAFIRVTDALTDAVLGDIANENLNGTQGSGENELNTKTLTVCKGEQLNFSWNTGQYDSEASYVILNGAGEEVFSGSGAQSTDPFFTLADACPSCFKPTALTASDETVSGATLTWTRDTRNEAGETYTIYNVTDDVVYQTGVTGTSITLTGLNENTNYEFTVTTNCSATDNATALSVTFTTLANCPAPVFEATDITNVTAHTADVEWTGFTQNDSYKVYYRTAEYVDGISVDFENGSMPAGWTTEGNGTWSVGTGDYSTVTGAHGGTKNALIKHGTTGNTTYLVTSAMDLSGRSGMTLNMWYINRSWSGDIDEFGVYYRIDGGAWNEIFATTTAHASWTELNVNLPSGAYAANCQIGFKMTDSYGYGVGIDDILMGETIPAGAWQTVPTNTTSTTLTGLASETSYEVKIEGICGGSPADEMSDLQVFTTLPSCMPVDGLAVGEITTNSIALTWSDSYNSGATYIIYMNGAEYATGVTGTSYTATGLTANTEYSFAVKASCGGDDYSAMTAAISARTACEAIALPHTWTFEAEELQSTTQATALPWCSYRKVESVTYPNYPYSYSGTSYAHESSRSLYFYGSTSTTYPEQMAWIMPAVDVTNFPMNGNRVTFYARSSSTSYNKTVHVGTLSNKDDWSTFTEVGSVTVTGTTHQKYTVALDNATATDAYVALMVERSSGNLYVDDLTLEVMPSCLEVTDLQVSGKTTNSITLTWTDELNPSATYVIYKDGDVEATNVTGTSYTATGLTSNTAYEFAVMANCGGDLSVMTPTVTERTDCEAITIDVDNPYVENFNDYTGNATSTSAPTGYPEITLPGCWSFVNMSSSTSAYPQAFLSSSSTYAVDGNCLFFKSSSTTPLYAILPEFTEPANNLRVNFTYRNEGTSTSNGTLQLGYLTDPSDMSTFVLISEFERITTRTPLQVLVPSEVPANARLAFSYVGGTANNYYLSIDDVTVEIKPSCMSVTNIAAADITTDGATISWTDAENTNVTYSVYLNGTENEDLVATNLTATTYTFTGLAPNTNYVAYVTPTCSGFNGAEESVSFTTLQVPATLPYTTGFETGDDMQWTLVNGTNGWYFGEAATDEGNSLYISNDGGVSNAYTNSTATASYAYRTINFAEAGYHTFAFDWKAKGETSAWDYMYAWLVPSSVELTANVMPAGMSTSSMSGTYCPEGWYDLTKGAKWNQTEWMSEKAVIEVAAAGEYKLVLMWRNDGSQGTNPPAAVDNIVVKAKSAFEPTDFTAENISATSATLTWTANPLNNGTETYTLYNNNVEVATGITGNNYTATLTANTDYNFTLVAVNGGDNSDAVALGLGVYEYPTQAGKMVYLGGTILNTVGNTSTMTLYRGLGDNLTEQANYTEGTYLTEALTTYTASNEWPVYGPMTVIYMGETATSANTGVAALTVGYKCPMVVSRDAVEETANGAYTWTTPEGAEYTYENHRDAALALNENGDIVATYTDTVRNAGKCDSIINTLQLTLHPDFVITVNDAEICEGESYTLTNADQSESFSYNATGDYTVLLHSVYGADSVVNLSLQMHPAPVAYINGRAEYTMNDYCDNFELTLTAGSSITGVNYEWEDASTDAVRTVTPHINNVYTLAATDPVTGCSSLTAATLTVNTQDVPVLTVDGDAAICFGQSATLTVTDANAIEGVTFRWRNAATDAVVGVGATLTVSPTETTVYTVTAEGACDVTSEPFTVTVNPLPVAEVATSATVLCAGAELTISATEGFAGYEWSNGATTATSTFAAATTGSYTVTVTDANGCVNEFTTANVTVNPVYELNDAQSVCFTQNPYTWGTQTITENGNYDQTFQTVNGCDSLVHLTFTFEEMSVNNTYREVCQNTDVTWGETTYPAVQESATLTYIDNSGDCPEQKNLVLTVNPVKASSFEQVVCDSYLWPVSNETYTESGAYPYTLQTVKGCDSVVTMNLTVNYQNTGIDEQTACDRYEWIDGNIYTESNNTATYTLQNALGCDSVVTLNLTVNYKNYAEYAHTECDATSYTWLDGETYNIDVEYNESGATYTYPGITNAAGCDSIAVLHLTMNYVLDTLNWTNVTECDNYYLDVVQCDGSIVREYFAESGDVVRRTRNAETGRDRISRIHLTINNSEHQTVPVTACVPYTWNVSADITIENINPVANDTVISQELVNEFGCNVIKVLRLTVLRPTENVTPVTLCQNDSWTDGNNVEYLAANYELGENERVQWNATTNAAGCDSIDYVVFTVNPVYNVEATLTYCENEFTNNAITYANPNNAAETVELTIPGALNQVVYNNTVVANWTTATGCDSIVTITYTVNPTRTENVDIQSCYTYTWNETEYNVSGDYTFNTQTVDGCDSTATLHLTIADTVTGIVNIEACGEYTYKGVTYRESMTFVEVSEVPAVSGCDSVTHFVYNLTPRVMKDVYIVANAPYTWDNNVEYSTSVENIYYDATEPGGCDSILVLHLTMEQPIVICENELPYTTTFGVTLTEDTTNYTETIEGVLYDIDYTVNHNTVETVTVDNACNSYEWHGMTYTESGNYTFDTINANGCDSTATLALTVNVSTDSVLTAVACDTYTWSGETFTESIDTTIVGLVNAKGCDSTATLHLTINKNEGVEETVVTCVSYTWMGTEYTASGDYSITFQDANGCSGDSVLHLTINVPTENNLVIIDTAASTYYNGTYYADINEANGGQPYTFDVLYENGNAKGCDSTDHVTLYVTRGTVTDENYNKCGEFTWDRNNHTYAWIDAAERQANGNALYKDITDATAPVYIHTGENPTAVVTDAMGVPTQTYVLWLNMIEANYFDYDLGTILLSQQNSVTVNPGDTLDAQTIDLSEFVAAKQNATLNVTLHHTSNYYCENVVTYTANLMWNYDTLDNVYVCNGQATYDWTEGDETFVETLTGDETTFTEIFAAGTANEMVKTVTVVRMPAIVPVDTAAVACDEFTWYGTTYTETPAVAPTHLFQVEHNGVLCDSTVTLNLTVNYSTSSVNEVTVCGTYTWEEKIVAGAAKVYTESNNTDTIMLTNNAGCDSIVTLNLTIYPVYADTVMAVACDSYTWTVNTFNPATGLYDNVVVGTYTESSNNDEVEYVPTQNIDVVIGNSAATTGNSYLPAYSLYEYSLTQQIYTADEIGVSGDINSLTMWLQNTSSYARNWQIYMKEVDKSTFASGSDWVSLTDADLVASGTIPNGISSFVAKTFEFNTPFSYTGTGNLLVCVRDMTGDWSSGCYANIMAGNGNQTMYAYRDGTVYDPTTPGVNGTLLSSKNVIGLNITTGGGGAFMYNAKNQYGCDSLLTLNLTINNHVDTGVYDTACVSYTWVANNNAEYTASGDYTRDITDANDCAATETLHLTINTPELFTRDQYVFGNGITINGHFYEAAATGVAHYTVVLDTVDDNGCATTVTVELYVSQYEYVYTNHVGCGSYTWTVADNGDDKVYRTMTATEAAANPTALYWNETDNAPVLEMPRHSDGNMIYVLNLTLNEPSVTEINVTALASQLGTGNIYSTVDGDIDCSAAVAAKATTVITEEFSMGPHAACDSIVRYNINVVYNYDTLAPVTYCENITTYTDSNNGEHNITVGDNAIDFTVNADADNEMNYHVVVTVTAHTPSAPQVVTACDTYTWEAGDGLTYNVSGTYNWNDDENCTAETLQLTINNHIDADVNVTICDTYTWVDNDNAVYTESGDYTRDITDVNECAATETLHLTINVNAGVEETVAACDSYSWTYAADPLTESNTYTETFTDGNGCEGTATLHLTINTNAGIKDTFASCYTYTWTYQSFNAVSNQMEDVSYTYTESGDKTETYVDANGCVGTATLNLTINGSESIDTAFWFGDGSYRYTGIFTTATAHMYTPGDYAGIVETVNGVTANGCDSIYNITLHVGNNYTHTDAVRSCATYTWTRNNTTYARLTDAQAAEYPTAIYFDQTNNEPVYYNPVVVEPRVNDYADEYMLDLTLDAIHEEDVVVDLPVFPGTLAYGDSSYNVALADHDMGRVFVDSTFTSDVHFGGVQYCDSIVHLTVNVINNYVDEGVVDLCYTESSYTWEGESIVLDANPDVLNEYYIYHVDAVNDTVKYQKVIQHPIQYVTERRVECDSYEWRGTVYTESTSGVVRNFTDQYGCDSTVTLVLTINHTTSSAMGSEAAPIVACDGYEWILSNNEAVSPKYTESGVYTMDYTSVEGCPSTDTLYLTINNSTETTVEAEGCGNYTWMNGDETVGTYTASGTYTHTFDGANVAGCDSTVTLTLTIHELPAIVYDAPDDHVCDAFVWTAQTWNGTEMVDTVFATITETAYSLYDTAYNEFGCPIPHYISAVYIDKSSGRTEAVACDNYEWHGTEYTESGAYEYVNPTTNACGNPVDSLYLTINKNSGHLEEVAICNSNLPAAGYEWNGSYYSTTGEYYYVYTDDNNCSSRDTLKLTIGNVRTYGRVYVENCGPYTWDVTGETFTESTEVSTIMDGANAVGCDSVIMLYLTIYEQPVINETVAICDNELVDYSWRGIAIAAAGEYTDFGGAFSEHCDSVYNLTLTVNERTYSSVDVTYCDSYEWNGETYTESGVYTYTTTNAAGCDNIDTLHLTINVNNGVEETELACDSYEWNGTNYTESGDYTVTYQDANGCSADSVLHLTIANSENNSVSETACDSYEWNGETYTESGTYTYNYNTPDGCAGVKTLELTVNSSSSAEVSDIACDSYEWNGETYTASGVYTYTTTNAAGCDSVVTLNLTINYNSNAAFTETACDSYEWNGTEYITSGDYTYSYTNAAGCASTDTLHLTVNYSSDVVTINETACDSYEWTAGNGETYTESGAYTYTTTNAAGCDSTVTLNLTINTSNTGEEEQTACDSYTWNGETYTESGVYTFNTTNAAGCDSTATLNLTINTSNTGVDVQTACDTYTWIDNNVYTASNNTATYTVTNVAGCDSVVTLNLTINNSVATSFADEACSAYVWEGSYYTESGDYTKTFEAVNGCDSVVTLTLTINQPVAETITETACGSYTWNGITYNASGSYTQTDVAANGCDSVTTLVLTINQPVTGTFTDAACDSYTWNGETYTESGAYTQTLTAANGCDSVVTLTLTINTPANTTEDVTACESYTWHGQVYTTNGAYTFNFTDVNGCAAVATLNLTINTPANTTETVTACNSYSWNNQTYTNSGVYTSTFVDNNGCNATATLNLTINNPVNAYVTATACESYTWNGQTYYTSGSYTYTATAANGCDSVTTLTLTINQPTTATVYAEACGSYTWNGQTYTQPGAYNYTTTGSNGCDSTVTLLLNLVQPVQTIINQTACDSYIWNGTTYTTSGSYSVTETAANGCDSVVTLNLTINNSVSSNFAETACNSYTWNGQAYTTSGTYTQVFTAHNGCDSTVTLNLTINTPTTATVTETACSSFDWNGETYTQSGSYTYTTTGANGCDSVTTLLLTINLPVYTNLEVNAEGSYSWNGETYTESGVYTYTTTAANGCDSIVTLTLTITPVYTVTLVSSNEAWGSVSESGTVAEYGYFTAEATANEGYEFVAWVNGTDTVSTSSTYIFQVTEDITLTAVFAEVQGISTVDMNNVVIYSNDTRIFVNGAEGYDVYVYDVNGRVISRQLKAADAIEFRMSTTGVYLVKVGNAPAKRVIVVR